MSVTNDQILAAVTTARVAVLDALSTLQDTLDVVAARLGRLRDPLSRLEQLMADVDDKLDALATAVDGVVAELVLLRDELANANQPGSLSADQRTRFDTIITNLNNAAADPQPPAV